MRDGEWFRKSPGNSSIVFVHGILSSKESCWRNENSGAYWPQLLADTPTLAHLGIYLFSYRSDIFSGSYSLSDVVDALKEHLRLDDVLGETRIIFVCHSMGGIAVRKFLVERATDLIDRNTEVGLFLVASPSLGSSYANWLNPLAQFLGHAQADALRFVGNNVWLSDLDKEFQNLKESGKLHIKGKELVEDRFIALKVLWRRQVVEPFAGARYFGEPFKVPSSDHFSIAKPDGAEAIQHRLLVQFIEEMVGSSAHGVQTASNRRDESKRESIIEKPSTTPDVRPPSGIQGNKYDLWSEELSKGFVRLTLSPDDAVAMNTLDRILANVMREKKFSDAAVGNAHVVLFELLANVARHARNSDATVVLELYSSHLPVIIVTVSDTGNGYDLWTKVEEQFLQMKANGREHGLGRICRLSDQVLPTGRRSSPSWFSVQCTLYDILWPSSLGDEYTWCEKVILDYSSTPPCVWFGSRRYPLWWHITEGGGWLEEWAALGALNFSIDHGIEQIMHAYLGHISVEEFPYLFFEVRGHGFTETGDPRTSQATIAETLESYFAQHFATKKVLLYASRDAYTYELTRLSQKYGIRLYVSESECAAALRKIGDRKGMPRSRPQQWRNRL